DLAIETHPGFVDHVRDALYSAKVVAYAQGLDQIRTASEEYEWNIDIADVAKIWRAGCIIRARLLEQIRSEYAGANLPTLLTAPSIREGLDRAQEGWRATVATAARAGVPAPGFSAALAYYDSVRAQRLPAALLQGLRDYFGAHTYQRVDDEGHFHIECSADRSETKMPSPARPGPRLPCRPPPPSLRRRCGSGWPPRRSGMRWDSGPRMPRSSPAGGDPCPRRMPGASPRRARRCGPSPGSGSVRRRSRSSVSCPTGPESRPGCCPCSPSGSAPPRSSTSAAHRGSTPRRPAVAYRIWASRPTCTGSQRDPSASSASGG